jgi:uncharacterized protein YprB with RNaseH-like and TPR domain
MQRTSVIHAALKAHNLVDATRKMPRVLVLDIETNGINGFKADLAYVLAVGYQWYNSDTVQCPTLADFETFKARPYDDRELMHAIHPIISQADVIAGHYLSVFDWPFLKSRFEKHGLPRIHGIKVLDTCMIARAHLKLSSNRLDNLAAFYGLDNAKLGKGRDWSIWWKRAAAGDLKAVEFIRKYCKQDVRTTTELLARMRAHWPKSVMGRIIMASDAPWPRFLRERVALDPKLSRRLRSRVEFGQKGDCWLWKGSTNAAGYGDFRYNGKYHVASRFMYETFVGQVPARHVVEHLCYNRACVNPLHLQIATRPKHVSDSHKRGRYDARNKAMRGAGNHQAKLTSSKIKAVRRALKLGKLTADIVKMCGLSPQQVQRIAAGKAWRE